MTEDISKKIADFLIENTIHVTPKGASIKCDNRVLKRSEFFRYLTSSYSQFQKLIIDNNLLSISDSHASIFVEDAMKIYKSKLMESRDTNQVFQDESINIDHLALVMDYKTGKDFVYNTLDRKISEIHVDVFVELLKRRGESTDKKIGTLTFNPYEDFTTRMTVKEGSKIVEFNTFLPPKWRCSEGYKLNLEEEEKYSLVPPPKMFMDFFEFLFPDKTQREFVLNWVYNAIFHRNETYLVLNGKKGAGKNIFCDLVGTLVGAEYYRKAPIGFLDSSFNSVLEEARLILLDELKVQNDQHQNKLKNYINHTQNVEKKGVDAKVTVETFNSYIINNNNISDLILVWDDRRFSVPDITHKTLKDFWSDDKISEFTSSFEDDHFIKSLGYWIKREGRKEEIANSDCIKGDRFWKIVHNSLPEWQKTVVDVCLTATTNSVSVATVRNEYKRRADASRFPFKSGKLSDFLSDYRYRGERQLGRLVGTGQNALIEIFKDNIDVEGIL